MYANKVNRELSKIENTRKDAILTRLRRARDSDARLENLVAKRADLDRWTQRWAA
jgi:hypothetical protein